MLVGQGAQSWARTNNIEMVDDDFLKTGKQLRIVNSKFGVNPNLIMVIKRNDEKVILSLQEKTGRI